MKKFISEFISYKKYWEKKKKLSPASAFAQLHSDNYYFKILT